MGLLNGVGCYLLMGIKELAPYIEVEIIPGISAINANGDKKDLVEL